MVTCTEVEFLNGPTVIFTMVNTGKAKDTVKAPTLGRMEPSTKVSTKVDCERVVVDLICRTENVLLGSS